LILDGAVSSEILSFAKLLEVEESGKCAGMKASFSWWVVRGILEFSILEAAEKENLYSKVPVKTNGGALSKKWRVWIYCKEIRG